MTPLLRLCNWASRQINLWILQILPRIEKILRDPRHLQALALWTSAILVGFTSVGYATLFRWAEHGAQSLIAWQPYAPFIVTPVLFVAAWWIVRTWAPEAAGSGIPQIMAANELESTPENQPWIERLLSLRTAGIKVISSLLCAVGGGAIGREGPTLQISASVFYFIGSLTKRYVPGLNDKIWIVAGAASGLASAFNTPLGGIVYAIEELGLVHFQKIRTALLSGVIVSGLMAQWLLGSYLYLGFPHLVPISFSFMPTSVSIGLITGILGGLFANLLLKLIDVRLRFKAPAQLAMITAGSGLVMACFFFYDARSAGPGIDLVSDFLFDHQQASFPLVVIRFFGTIITYLSGAAGGIFSPSLSIGATIGSFIESLMQTGHPNLMVLLGMIGFLTGVTRTPFTSFILVLEMTDRHSAIFPMMLAAVAAQWSARLIDSQSFYEHVKLRFLKGS